MVPVNRILTQRALDISKNFHQFLKVGPKKPQEIQIVLGSYVGYVRTHVSKSGVPNTLIKTRIVSENSVFFIQLTKHNGIVKLLAKKHIRF